MRFLLQSSRDLSAAGTCKLSSMTFYPHPSHTDTPGSLDSCWLLGSSERKTLIGSENKRLHVFTLRGPSSRPLALFRSHLKPVANRYRGITHRWQRLHFIWCQTDSWRCRRAAAWILTTTVSSETSCSRASQRAAEGREDLDFVKCRHTYTIIIIIIIIFKKYINKWYILRACNGFIFLFLIQKGKNMYVIKKCCYMQCVWQIQYMDQLSAFPLDTLTD